MIFVCLALQLFTQEEHNVNKTLIIGTECMICYRYLYLDYVMTSTCE